MEFCPDCGAMLMPDKGKVKCRCGYEKSLTSKDIEEQYTFEGNQSKQKLLLLIEIMLLCRLQG